MRFSRFACMVLALAVVGCGGLASDENDITTATPAASVTSVAGVSISTSEQIDPTAYLVALANGSADRDEDLRVHEERVNAEYENQSTEDEQLAYLEAYFGGEWSIHIQHAHWLNSLTPPPAFTDAHARYVEAYFGFYEPILERTERLMTIADWEEWGATLSDPSETYLALAEACQEVVDTAAAEGYQLELGCPTPPPEEVEVDVEVGSAWVASPDVVPMGNVVVELTITNVGDAPIRVVVLDVFDGDPLDLPIENGLVDLAVSGVTFDSDTSSTHFGVAYPDVFFGEDSQLGEPPPEVRPGETVFAMVHGSGPIVVFDYTAGQFEAGAHVVIQRGGETE